MDMIVSATVVAPALILLLSLVAILLLTVKIIAGKSIGNPEFPPVSGTLFGQLFYFGTLYDRQTDDAKKHPTFRILYPDQSSVYTVDPRNVEHVLKTSFHKYTKGEYHKEIFKDLFGEGIFAVDSDKWRRQRKLASYEFSTRVLRDFSSSVFRKNAARLVVILTEEMVAQGKDFDVQDLLMRAALDTIFKVGFGVDLNCLEGSSREGIEFMTAFDDANALVYWRYLEPLWRLKRYFNVGTEACLKKRIDIMDSFVNQLIRTKREQLAEQRSCNDKEDILSRFLLESEKDPEKMNDEYLRDIILNFMIAGKDTTANTLSWFLYVLCKNPFVQENVFQEIREVIGIRDPGTECTDPSEFVAKITEAVLDRMHYLHAALSETLRLYPAVPLDGRCAEADDVLPDGYRVKKGDGVYYIMYSMGRMKSLWGEDAEDFKPERWLNDDGIFQPESPFKFPAFNAGPRTCLGKDFAYRQMKIFSIALLRFFRFRLADEARTVTYRTMFTLHINGGLFLRAVPRTRQLKSEPSDLDAQHRQRTEC